MKVPQHIRHQRNRKAQAVISEDRAVTMPRWSGEITDPFTRNPTIKYKIKKYSEIIEDKPTLKDFFENQRQEQIKKYGK